MTNRSTIPLRLNATAPWLTLAVLAALAIWLPNRVAISAAADSRQVEIAAAMADVPFFIGDWIGKDAPVPREAQELLRPNATLSRTYQRPGGARLHVLVVHCSDARDMIGHYPPICYPSSGWVRMSRRAEHDVVVATTDVQFSMRTYQFYRVRDHGVQEVIRIFNAFVLPDGAVTRDIDAINRQSERLAVSVQGVAQIQIISSEAISEQDAAVAAGELLSGMSALRNALWIGRGETDES